MKIKKIYNNLLSEQKDMSFSIDDNLKLNDSITMNGMINGIVFGRITIGFNLNSYWKFEDEMSEDRYDELFPDDSFASIETIEVTNEFKGKGLARPLMSSGLDYIKKEGENVVYLNASPMGFTGLGLTNLVNFYKSFGFEIIVDDYSENKEMIKYL